MGQSWEFAQNIQVRQLGEIVRRQHQVRQVGNRVGKSRLDGSDAVARQEQCADTRREREIAEDLDVVIREVEGILWLCSRARVSWEPRKRARRGNAWNTYARDTKVLNSRYSVSCLPAMTKNSISTLALNDQKCSICPFR